MCPRHANQRPLDGDGAADLALAALEDGLAVPIPDLARPGILEHNRQVAEAAARRDA
ncbi:MAG: hypothetical protein HY718_15395, partial [Planctomycetes bacterium]|nr:hypothetical protein [Planctomycetota bacterium]